MNIRFAALLLAATIAPGQAAELFPLPDVRLTAGPFLAAQSTNRQYLMALDADKLLAPFRREAGLPPKGDSYGNWESSGLDGHMGGHYLSALALMHAATGDAAVLKRLNYLFPQASRIPAGCERWRLVKWRRG